MAAILALGVLCGLVLGQEPEPSWRRYEEGPLQASDFRGRPPRVEPDSRGVKIVAVTKTDVRHTYRFLAYRRGGKAVARLTAIQFFGVILRDQSWNRHPENAALMDHEQGHLDLAAIQASRIQADIDRLIKDKRLRGVGANPAAAHAALLRKVLEAISEKMAALRKAQRSYDQCTLHGSNQVEQENQRRQQRELLSVLLRDSERKRPAVRGRSPSLDGECP